MATHRGKRGRPTMDVPVWSHLTSQFQVLDVLILQQMKCLQMWSLEMGQPGPGVGTHRALCPRPLQFRSSLVPVCHPLTSLPVLWSPCPGLSLPVPPPVSPHADPGMPGQKVWVSSKNSCTLSLFLLYHGAVLDEHFWNVFSFLISRCFSAALFKSCVGGSSTLLFWNFQSTGCRTICRMSGLVRETWWRFL